MANRIKHKRTRQLRRKMSVRKGLSGTPGRPRLTVFRSARHIYAQVVNDMDGTTLVSSSTMCKDLKTSVKQGGNVDAAKAVGVDIAEKAMAAGIDAVVFDRNGFKYHGRLQALADAAREKGLKF